jgi:hypothetical protein
MGSSSARVLRAIQPGRDSIDADELEYPDLYKIIKEQRLGTRSWQVQGSPLRLPVDILNRDVADDIAETYLLQIAYRLQKAHLPMEKKYWSKRYTKASVNLYGAPKADEISAIASLELDYFEDITTFSNAHIDFLKPVIRSYKSLLGARNPLALGLEERYKLVLGEVREYYLAEYEEVFACFDDFAPDKYLEPYQVAECFYRALDVLERQDKAWADWSILLDESAKMSVNVVRKQINIGKYRAPVHYSDVKGLFAHEVLVHAMRSVNGAKIDESLAYGLPGYLTTEEGLGVLVGSAVNGKVASKVRDKYIDIALALGGKHRRPMTRQELFIHCYSRAVARHVAEDKDFDPSRLEGYAWEHVNRIYRGTLGNKYVGVFTKDVSYYQGLCQVADYLLHVMAQGRPIKQGLECLLQGKFDPSNNEHIKYVYSKGISV